MADLLILDVLLVLGFAVIAGEIFDQMHLPSIAGELLAGASAWAQLFGLVTIGSQIRAISSIALFSIIFSIGARDRNPDSGIT